MSSSTSNNVAFRLPESHLQELSRLAKTRKQSKGRLAKDIVMAALMDFSRFDELGHQLGTVDRMVRHLVERLESLESIEAGLYQLKATLAAVTTRLLVDGSQVDLEEAVAWTKETFGVEEQT